jgi:2-dehydro-3-deoxyphosphooctonate aldolase (KDO 8-P synthase)
MQNPFKIKAVIPDQQHSMVLIAGPCVIEDFDTTYSIASSLKNLSENYNIPFVFKASYDKANRSSIQSYRGPGLSEGLKILQEIKASLGIKILSDVHRVSEVESAAEVLDVIQIPAFLCRQTDILLAIAKTGKPINVKKGQFMAPWDMANVAEKIISAGNRQLWITERGTMFGYNNLVVDFRSLKILKDMGLPVIFDATHSVQLPGGAGSRSDGQREFAPTLAKAAVAAGADGIFMEVHPNPEAALCDGPNSVKLDQLDDLLKAILAIYHNR